MIHSPNSDTPDADKHPDVSRAQTRIMLAIILLLAVFLRTYQLSRQALDWDEANGMMALNGHGFLNSMRLTLTANDLSMPLYYLVQYAASAVIGTSLIAIRLLSVALSLATIPVLYLIGRDTFGKRAGLMAALLFALSPVYIFNGQMTRHYALLTLLAAVSIYLVYGCARFGGRRWLYLSALTNILVALTHFFGILLIASEAAYLLLVMRRPFRRIALWVCIQGIVLALPWFLWLKANMSAPESAFPEYSKPTVQQVVFDIAGDDVVGRGPSGASPSWRLWSFVSATSARRILDNRYIADWAMVAAFLTTILWLAVRLGRSARDVPLSQWSKSDAGAALYLMMIVTLPVLALAAASYVVRPCIMPRYTVYCALALYTIAGGAIAAIRRKGLRIAAIALFILLYGAQLSILLPGPTRTDWFGVADSIRAHQTPSDLILVSGAGANEQNTDVFHRNITHVDVPIEPAFTLQSVCDKAVCHLERTSLNPEMKPSVWALFNRYYAEPFRNFDQCLEARGLAFDVRNYPGGEGLILYRIQAGPDFPSLAHAARQLIETDIDYDKLLSDWGVHYDDPAKQEVATKTLRRIYEANPPMPGSYPLNLFCTWLAEEGAIDVALDVARAAKANGHDEGEINGIEAYLLWGRGDLDGARKALEKTAPTSLEAQWTALYLRLTSEPFERVAPTLNSFTFFMYKPLLEAMFLYKDSARALLELHRLYAADQDIPLGIIRDLNRFDWLTPCPMQP